MSPTTTTVKLLGREFEVPHYRLGKLRRAAPFVDVMNKEAGMFDLDNPTLDAMTRTSRPMVEILAIGLEELDPELTPDGLDNRLGLEDLGALSQAVKDVLRDAGLSPKGGALAPSAQGQTEGASPAP